MLGPSSLGEANDIYRQVSWLTDHPSPHAFPPIKTSSGCTEFRPRIQWRDRDGFTPSSLFSGYCSATCRSIRLLCVAINTGTNKQCQGLIDSGRILTVPPRKNGSVYSEIRIGYRAREGTRSVKSYAQGRAVAISGRRSRRVRQSSQTFPPV